jgi:hypothetical protein
MAVILSESERGSGRKAVDRSGHREERIIRSGVRKQNDEESVVSYDH